MWVKDYMLQEVDTIHPDATVAEAVKKMVDDKTNSLIIVDEDKKPLGVFSSYILIREAVPAYLKDNPSNANFGAEGTLDKYAEDIKCKKVSEIMDADVHTLTLDDAMIEAAAHSLGAEVRLLPVVDDEGVLKGAISRTCIKNALYNTLYKDCPIDPSNGGCDPCKNKE